MTITGMGWELLVRRTGVQRSGARRRTYGTYQVYREGRAAAGLSGFMAECAGPGDNRHPGNGRRIEAGRYPLWTQFGTYRTIGYAAGHAGAGAAPMPGLRLEGTGRRTGILIHPAHPPDLYLSSTGCLNPSGPLSAGETMRFDDSRARTVALIESLRDFVPAAFAHETTTRLADAFVVVEGEPTVELGDPAPADLALLPISKAAALDCARWLVHHFGDALEEAAIGKPYGVRHLCAIACQESAYKWLKWTADHDPAEILGRCVFDASGDYPGTSRTAFPRNTAAFRARYGAAFTAMLVEEANRTRRMQGWGDKPWVYKGYGLFQYDLQHVRTDEAFFRERKWYSFAECLARCCEVLDAKLGLNGGDLWAAVRAYNGSGARAEAYMRNVKLFAGYCAEITG